MLFVSITTLACHGATAYFCTFLPSDPLHVCTSITAYVWNACALSLLGVVGICIRSPSLVTVFANHLLIDAFVSLIPKLGLTLIVNRHTATYPGAAATDRYQVMTWKSTLVAQLFKDCQSVVVV
ncbi:hypothetical protein KCU71_g181, partial [Aureobasidium melanogenum]